MYTLGVASKNMRYWKLLARLDIFITFLSNYKAHQISGLPKFTLIYALFILESVDHILQEYVPRLPNVSPRLPATANTSQ